jgi:hypothetical protein
MIERRPEALSAVRALGDRVRPLALARERMVPVDPLLGGLFPEGGLRRGSVVGCTGPAPFSLALALVAAASRAGSWVGVVGLPTFGVAAAVEWGVAMERVFSVAAPPPTQVATILAAVADGAEVVVADTSGVSAGEARRLAARLTGRGGVLVTVGDPGGLVPDVVCRIVSARWEGLGVGSGSLQARRVVVEAGGRRVDRLRRAELWFPGPAGAPAPVGDLGLVGDVGPVGGVRETSTAIEPGPLVARAG